MAILKQHLTPIGRAGKIVKHAGKGAVARHLPGAATGGYSNSLNDYSQATPMANPTDTADQPATPGLPFAN
jgi:hypothetical protein